MTVRDYITGMIVAAVMIYGLNPVRRFSDWVMFTLMAALWPITLAAFVVFLIIDYKNARS